MSFIALGYPEWVLRSVFCAQEQPSYDKKQFLGWAKASLGLD